LRLFLGVTFIYAGLQKLTDRWFFKTSAPSSLQSQLHAAARTSPISGMASAMSHVAVPLGLVIAFGELAVGLGALLGLWTRYAAAAGMLLSVGFFLMVSYHTRPFYYGADIVFVFAWTPLLIAGGGRWSLDAWTASEARRQVGLREVQPITVGFDTVQRLCGAYDKGRCRAQGGRKCRPTGCPVLADPTGDRFQPEIDRRAFLEQAGLAGWLASAALLMGGGVALLGRLVPPRASSTPVTPTLGRGALGPSTTPASTTSPATTALSTTATSGAPTTGDATPAASSNTDHSVAGEVPTTQLPTSTTQLPIPTTAGSVAGTRIGPASDVPVGGAAQFNDPATGDPAYVVQPTAGHFVAFDAICTHQGCTVQYAGSIFACPCHGAEFDSRTGAVVRGPAQRPLAGIPLREGGDGNLYVT